MDGWKEDQFVSFCNFFLAGANCQFQGGYMLFLFCDVHNKHLLLLYGLPHSTGVIADLPYALPFPSDDTSNESHGDIYPLLSGRDGEGNVSINPQKTKWLLVFTIISRVFLDLGHPRLSLKVKLLDGFRVCKVWAGLEFGSPKLVYNPNNIYRSTISTGIVYGESTFKWNNWCIMKIQVGEYHKLLPRLLLNCWMTGAVQHRLEAKFMLGNEEFN